MKVNWDDYEVIKCDSKGRTKIASEDERRWYIKVIENKENDND
jgi:hypothetical protein